MKDLLIVVDFMMVILDHPYRSLHFPFFGSVEWVLVELGFLGGCGCWLRHVLVYDMVLTVAAGCSWLYCVTNGKVEEGGG